MKVIRLFACLLAVSSLAQSQSSGFGISSMPPTILTLQMIIDFAVDQKWKQVIIFDCIDNNDCTRPYSKPLVECFSQRDILVAIKSLTDKTDLPKILRVETHRVGVILFLDDIDLTVPNNALRKINKMIAANNLRSTIFGDYASWLLLSTKWNSSQIFDSVRDWPIGADSDVSVAMSFLPADFIISIFRQFYNRTCLNLRNYGNRYDYARLKRSQSIAPAESIFVQDTLDPMRTLMVFYTVTVYKIRIDNNASLESENWNTWSPSRNFSNDRSQPKQRNNLRRYIMNFGLQNSSKYYGEDYANTGQSNEHKTLSELIKLFEICLNVTANVTHYVYNDATQTGKEINDLDHGITSGDIDLGAAYLDVYFNADKMMDFTFPLVRFYRNIYFKPPEMSNNIFLRPFSPHLLGCVILTFVLVVSVMEIINYVTLYIHWQEDEEHFGLGEAALWCFSIMCTQGSPWTPKTRAGKAVLLCSLFFSLIIYNSYSGFITSILSVKSNSIKNVSDFVEYHYTFGCSRTDERYLAGAKDDLRSFYMRALESDQVKVPEKEGLQRTFNGSYAFFISETIARRLFHNALRFDRCKIEELQTKTTLGILALPIPQNSPYKKMINNGILRMWQYGVLSKLTQNVKPRMLDCMSVLEYQKARLSDVYGAFCILGIGAIAAVILFFFERAWIRRNRIVAIQRRLVGVKRSIKRNTNVLDTARLSMKILGINRELQDDKDSHDYSGFKLFKDRNNRRDESSRNDTLFPYYP